MLSISSNAENINSPADNNDRESRGPCHAQAVPADTPEKHVATIDIIFAVLLLIATLSTAVCVYQATRWNGEQATDYGESAHYRSESIRATTTANSQIIIDVGRLFLDWVNAVGQGTSARRPSSKNGSGPSSGRPSRPGRPRPMQRTRSRRERRSTARNTLSRRIRRVPSWKSRQRPHSTSGKDANEYGDLYISNTVLFAIVLFFCGVYSRWEEVKIRQAILAVTLIVFVFALYSMGSLLFRVGYI